ncbi:MAG: DUF4234 domain-containing protein [Eubacteriales bacterium]|nr:DUF4234 domain-containing protein [Eubacteriales bacterium]
MKSCPYCNNQIDDGVLTCPFCGQSFYAQEQQSQQSYAQQPVATGPALKFKDNRSLVKMILLGLITFGIYSMVNYSQMVDELNMAASRYDGKKTMPYFGMIMLAPVTYFIFVLVWFHKFSERVGNELKRRGYNYSFGCGDFWLWNVLGALIIVGPFIYLNKLVKSMNMINASYNMYG